MSVYDLVIRRGTVIDGRGSAPQRADIAIKAGRIVKVGEVAEGGSEEIDAEGLLVTPGFVDIHTHYDGQVTWSHQLLPSPLHGITTVVTGNCGVGFAPCKEQDREMLVKLMEGVEDVPEVVMAEGLPWDWESFPDYMDRLAARDFDIDVACQLPHSALRVYVMGERGFRREAATADDCARMGAIAAKAVEAGAIGFGTSRILMHRASTGDHIPSLDAGEAELRSIAEAMAKAGGGVLQFVIEFGDTLDEELALLRRLVEVSGLPLSMSLGQVHTYPAAWQRVLDFIDEANRDGLPIRAQVIGRPTGSLMGFQLSAHPFTACPSYAPLAKLPFEQQVQALRDPETRNRLIHEEPVGDAHPLFAMARDFDWLFPLGDPPNYEPPLETSIGAQGRARGVSPAELAYDLMMEQDGKAILFRPFANYATGSLDPVLTMLRHPNTVLGLGDGGAHYGIICDSSWPTFMLTHWVRDRQGERLDLVDVVRSLSSAPAHAVGLCDRGIIAEGYKADINVIDHGRLRLLAPDVRYDLPAGGRRINQSAEGFSATIVSGTIIYRDGQPTGALPGRVVRGAQGVPANQA